MPKKTLTPKQALFVREYPRDFNASQAALRAGYSPRTAAAIGHENLRKPNIRAALGKITERRLEKVDVTVERIVDELALLGFSDFGDYAEFVGKDGRTLVIRSLEDLPPGASRAIQSMESFTDKDGEPRIKLRLYDKRGALEILAKHLGMVVDRMHHTGKVGVELGVDDLVRLAHEGRNGTGPDTLALQEGDHGPGE
ncbi:terminase small subunit [uncultured Mediterranean phage]|nr:terminase small subunit [uncultured Mediterranean phage]